mgnify:FL=1
MNVKNATEIGGNYVGVEVKSIQDVVKAQAAGLIITDECGCRYNYWDVDEETGEEREPTEQEIFDRITKDLADDEHAVYACMEIMDGLYVAKEYNTVMHTDFYVGQKVYLLRDNKIVEDEIIYISLVRSKHGEECKFVLGGDQGHYIKSNQVFATKQDLVNSLMAE